MLWRDWHNIERMGYSFDQKPICEKLVADIEATMIYYLIDDKQVNSDDGSVQSYDK